MSASSEAKADPPPPAQNDAEDYLKMDALAKEMAAQVHPLSLSEYQDMQKRFLETVDKSSGVDSDEPFVDLYAIMVQHCPQENCALFLKQYSIRSREIALTQAIAQCKEFQDAVATLKARRTQAVKDLAEERISKEEEKEIRLSCNKEINGTMEQLQVAQVLQDNAQGAVDYANKHGMYKGFKAATAPDVKPPPPADPDVIELDDEGNDATTTPATPHKGDAGTKKNAQKAKKPEEKTGSPRKTRRTTKPRAKKGQTPGPKPPPIVGWSGSCDQCTKEGKKCSGSNDQLRCDECENPRKKKCLYNGINVYGEIKGVKKTLAQWNGQGFSYPASLEQDERILGEHYIRQAMVNARTPTFVKHDLLAAKLKHCVPAHAAPTVFLHAEGTLPQKGGAKSNKRAAPRTSGSTSKRRKVGANRAVKAEPEGEPEEDEDDDEQSSEDESEDEEDDAGGEEAAEEESVTARPSAPPPSVLPPNAPSASIQPANVLPPPFAHPSHQSGEYIMPTPSASLAGRVGGGTLYSSGTSNEHHQAIARDRYVAEIRRRYNDMVVARAVSASQMDALRLAEERATGMTFGLYHYSTFDPCQQDVVSSGDLTSVSRR